MQHRSVMFAALGVSLLLGATSPAFADPRWDRHEQRGWIGPERGDWGGAEHGGWVWPERHRFETRWHEAGWRDDEHRGGRWREHGWRERERREHEWRERRFYWGRDFE